MPTRIALVAVLVSGLSALPIATAGGAASGGAPRRMGVPESTRQLIVVSAPTSRPPGPESLATLRAYAREPGRRGWRLVYGPWPAETGRGHLVPPARRREGDHATPTGVFGLGATVYGTAPRPGRLAYPYHRLVCGDWWDEDVSSARYNRFVHVPCGATPGFAAGSEALWTEPVAYRYLLPIGFNVDPIRRGSGAPGSAIFLHSWVGAATNGCIALGSRRLLELLRWLRPRQDPRIAIGTAAQVPTVS